MECLLSEWDIEELRRKYITAEPFEYVVIPNFFTDDVAHKIHNVLPDPNESWWIYDNPFENKYVLNEFTGNLKNIFDFINSEVVLTRLRSITNIHDLENDPYFHAGGLHAYGRNGKCGLHLDYNIHPVTYKERRVSLMVYMCKDWQPEYGGKLELWDKNLTSKTIVDCDMWNTAILFKTNEINYHGIPNPIKCPSNMYRKVIGVYYMSEPTQKTLQSPRKGAVLIPTPGEKIDERLQLLYDLRKTRRLTPSDLDFWPTWKKDCGLLE
jgi:hypothetical protein